MVHSDAKHEAIVEVVDHNYEGMPTDEELSTLRRVAGNIPYTAYVLCFVEFCERGSYYSAVGVISNFVNRVCPSIKKSTYCSQFVNSSLETPKRRKWLRSASTWNPANGWCFRSRHGEGHCCVPVIQDAGVLPACYLWIPRRYLYRTLQNDHLGCWCLRSCSRPHDRFWSPYPLSQRHRSCPVYDFTLRPGRRCW